MNEHNNVTVLDQYKTEEIPEWAQTLVKNQESLEQKLNAILEVVASMREDIMPSVHKLLEHPMFKMLGLGNKED